MNALPPETCGDLAQRLGVGRDEQRRAERVGVGHGGVAGAEGDRVDRDLQLPRGARDGDGVAADGGLAVGEQDDRRRAGACRSALSFLSASMRDLRARRRWRWRRRRPGRRRCAARRRGRCSAPARRRACPRTRRRRRAPGRAAGRGTCCAARCAAARRSGSTSVADIEREWSVTSMIDARSTAPRPSSAAWPAPATSAASAASASAAGRWRRQAGTARRGELERAARPVKRTA